MTRRRKGSLTPKEEKFVREVKRLTPDGDCPGPLEFNEAVKRSYTVTPDDYHSADSKASTLAGQLLKRPRVWEELAGMGMSDVAREKFRARMWEWLLGENEKHKDDKELMQTAARLLARGLIPQEEHQVVDTNIYAGRSTEEIEYYAQHGRWPEEISVEEISGELGDDPKVVMPMGKA